MPPQFGAPPPPHLMEQFSPPPLAEPPLEAPVPVGLLPAVPPALQLGNGAHPPFNGIAEPSPQHPELLPMGGAAMPLAAEENPLLAAMAQQAELPPPFNMELPAQSLGSPPRAPAAARSPHAGPNGTGNGARRAGRPVPDFSGLPPAMAESLAKLAGVPWPPQADADEREFEQQVASAPPGTPRRGG
jgi:hypothetical protein